ncbi:DUF6214 family protein [Streptomyces sp. NPDC047002]|uniref:DUF6214 family protein n=1 Tax=Streptomyces sp. NPDC047002 TaxID=3155475 RepID=UPI00345140D9
MAADPGSGAPAAAEQGDAAEHGGPGAVAWQGSAVPVDGFVGDPCAVGPGAGSGPAADTAGAAPAPAVPSGTLPAVAGGDRDAGLSVPAAAAAGHGDPAVPRDPGQAGGDAQDRATGGRHRGRGVAPWGAARRRDVAQVYRAARERGDDPVLAVMAATGRSRRRSLRLIAGARDEGHLPSRRRRG